MSRSLASAIAHERARTALRGHDEIVAAATHDMGVLLREISDRACAQQDEEAAPVRRAVARLERIADEIREVTSLDTTRLTTTGCAADVGTLAAEIVANLVPGVRDRVALEPDAGSALVARCDARLVGRAIEKLLDAALEVTPPGESVGVRVDRLGSAVRVTVADAGPPVEPELLTHVFDPSWPVEGSPRARPGLGLYVARVIVEAHGGMVGAVPRDRGLTLFLTVPAAPST